MATEATLGWNTIIQRAGVTVPEVRSIEGPVLDAPFEDVTHMESPSGYREYIVTLRDPGEVTLTINFDPKNVVHQNLLDDFVNNTLSAYTLAWAGAGQPTWSFSAYVSRIAPSSPSDAARSAVVTLRVSGAVTFS